MSPCFECKNHYNREYSKECDNICDYAKAIKELKKLKKFKDIMDNEYQFCSSERLFIPIYTKAQYFYEIEN